jgi:hypothetical protein
VALAHREYEQSAAEIERKLKARARAPDRNPEAPDGEAFLKLCAVDPELQKLARSMAAQNVWRDINIKTDTVATIEDDGRVRWTLPQYSNKRD